MKKKRVLPNGWHEVVIGKEFKTGSGGTPLSTRKEYYEGGTIPWINSGELNENYIDRTDNYISELGLNNSSAKLYPKGTVLVAMYGATAGKSSILNIEACTNQAICAILENSNYSSLFVKYSIENLYDYLVNKSTGSARDNLSQEGIAELSLFFPDGKDRQERLIKILKDIDQKISINVRMNAELEAMAKQIYNYWFVQFDFPDENGHPYKSSGGKMVYNEKLKREIPEGWGAKPVSNFIEHINTGLNPRQNFVLGNGNIKYITVKNLRTDGTIDFSNCDLIDEDARAKVHKRSGIQIKDILFASIAPLGRCHIIMRDPDDWDINESVFSIRPKQEIISPYYLYIYFMSDWFVKKAEKESAGSIFAGIRVNSLMEMPLLYAPHQIFESFEEKVDSLFIKRELLSNEINYLTHLRDSLLPMLMNGQVTVE